MCFPLPQRSPGLWNPSIPGGYNGRWNPAIQPVLLPPHPERVLEKYPLDPLKKAPYIPPLNHRIYWDTLFESIKEGAPGIKHEDAVEATNHVFGLNTVMMAGNWYRHADMTQHHIMGQIDSHPRKGRPGLLSFFDLGSPRMFWR